MKCANLRLLKFQLAIHSILNVSGSFVGDNWQNIAELVAPHSEGKESTYVSLQKALKRKVSCMFKCCMFNMTLLLLLMLTLNFVKNFNIH